ncbi:hypothetical protein DICPUDRAFT_147419 [Dictyostelium purpureum]|uniref:Importin N-terminal domain-containing protein n=1 Tax=Dictyostelium purpureum TaxID=5786 RepID=F0Z8F6_DICPU|nr:uncharacterized protein DICPUDRAFT_147419 [Dictyostelium purpureum]EGC39753.1 hypothetical protein DICPUDRAFT_147419 [Dictyostelium purpureum]|eukprot:XP_003283739.1 hypothetical protein DICPUDRAFT_147419 [Dictyostelium purpureum]
MNNELSLVVNQIEQALSLLHGTTSTNQQREESQKFLEEVKNRPNAHSYAIVIISSSNNNIVKHYALHIIETLVKTRWYEATDQEREIIKKEILEMMSRISAQEQKFIKEKLVTIIVEVIKRDWPQRWMNLLSSLIEISAISDTQTELVLLTFGQLPHDIIEGSATTNVLSDQRRKDLMAGINQAVSSLFEFFFKLLESRYTLYKQNEQQKIKNPQNVHLINVLLNTLGSYIEWIPSKVIFDHKLDHIFCQLLLDTPFRMGSCENLILFLNRKGRPDERIELLNTPFNLMEIFFNAIKNSSNFDDDYSFHKRITQALTLLGTVHLNAYDSKHKIPTNYSGYLQLMMQMFGHPSILLSSLAFPFWLALLKVDLEVSYKEELVKQILEIILSKFVRIGDPEKSDNEKSKFSQIDFATSKEWSSFYGGVRNRYHEIVKIITTQYHDTAYLFIINKIIEILESLKSNINLALSHEQALILESHSHFLENVLSTIKDLPCGPTFFNKSLQTNQVVTQQTEKALQLLFEINSLEPNVTAFQIDTLQVFTLYYQTNPDTIKFILNKIIVLIPFPGLDSPSKSIQNSVLHTRRKAISSLISISIALGDLMNPYSQTIYQSIMELFQKDAVNNTEKVMLFHLLIVFSNSLPTYQQVLAFNKEILGPIIELWLSPDMVATIQTPDSFIQNLGLNLPDDGNTDQIFINRRKTLYFVIAAIQMFWKKCTIPTNSSDENFAPFISNGISYYGKWPVSSFIKEVLPGLVTLIRTIHRLWDPVYKAKIHPSLSAIYSLDDAITNPLLGLDYSKDLKSESQNVTYVRNLLDTIRDGSYEIIGFGFTHSDELYGIKEIANILYDSVFSYLEFVENRHLKLIIKHVLAYLIKTCPSKLQSQIFDPILPLVFSIFFNRIKEGWEIIATRSQKIEKDEKTEIIDDKILRDFCLDFLSFAQIAFAQPYILTNPDITTPLAYSFTSCISAADFSIIKKAIALCCQLVELEKSDPRFFKLIASEIFGSCIKVLILNKTQEITPDIIALLRLIYIKYYQISNFPQEVLLQLPNITPQILQSFNQELVENKTEKAQKALFRKLLNDIIGINSTKLKKETIHDLPEKLYIQKVSSSSWIENNNQKDLSDLFN